MFTGWDVEGKTWEGLERLWRLWRLRRGEGEETDVIGSELLVVKQLHKHDTCGASIMHDSQQQTYCTVSVW